VHGQDQYRLAESRLVSGGSWAWRTRTGFPPPRWPGTSRREAEVPLGATSIIYFKTTHDELGERSSSRAGAAVPAQGGTHNKKKMERSGSPKDRFAPASKRAREPKGFLWRSGAARSAFCYEVHKGGAARSGTQSRPRSFAQHLDWIQSQFFGALGKGETDSTALPCTGFPPCKAFRSCSCLFMTPVSCGRPETQGASRVDFGLLTNGQGGLKPTNRLFETDRNITRVGVDKRIDPVHSERSSVEQKAKRSTKDDGRSIKKGSATWHSSGGPSG